MIVPVIQARYNSSRFPGKVLEDFGGRALIGWTFAVARKAFPAYPPVVAIPVGDIRLKRWCDALNWRVVEGPEDDVLSRFVRVIDELAPADTDIVVRLTADDPLKIPLLVWLAARLVELGAPYADTNHGNLTGFGAEAFTVTVLREADRMDTSANDREHVTVGMRRRHPAPGLRASIDSASDIAWLEQLMVGAPA